MPGLGIGLREHRVEVRDAGVRDEPLRAVEDVLVAVAPRGRAHRGRVGARAGLGERVGREPLARREPRQPRALLLVRPAELEPERAELLHGEDQPARRADLRDLLDRDEREQRAGAGAAVLLVEEQPEDPVLAEELDDVPRELVRGVDLGRARRDPLARERAYQLADLALLVAPIRDLTLELRRAGEDVVDLGFGNPDLPSPRSRSRSSRRRRRSRTTTGTRRRAGSRSSGSRAPTSTGAASASSSTRRPQVVTTMGAKEGFVHLMWVLLEPGDAALVPSPSYPIHIHGPMLAGASVFQVPMGPDEDFFANLEEAWERARPRPRVIVLSFPHNPTTATRRPRDHVARGRVRARARRRRRARLRVRRPRVRRVRAAVDPPGARAPTRSRSSSTR